MDLLQVHPIEISSVKAKAVEDAQQMQTSIINSAQKTDKDPPKYVLMELIGKGSFGRVYKAKDMSTASIVAVKIIDIDESDTINPRNADSYSEFLKEVGALKILSEQKARNINNVIEALSVGQSMWMITEYCGGGSVATLMRGTSPHGLPEKWIIPILREVAEAIKWVHQAGIIHRDIKCANVLLTEEGGVQLCDFGVAGIIETKLSKRSTFIGTLHWMAPELFDSTLSYGKEVDIWAFGSMVYEIATGLPPNVTNSISYEDLGSHLKSHIPRLEGGNYSTKLRNLVAYCLEELPSSRPTIEEVQKHPYISDTSLTYPNSTLSQLVQAFRQWENHGGSRKSLFMYSGTQGPPELSSIPTDDEWNFNTTLNQGSFENSNSQYVFEMSNTEAQKTARPLPPQGPKSSRRRPPPEALAPLRAPLEKIFDPNTISNYEDNSQNHYSRAGQLPISDLPLRDDSTRTSIRDTMIDIGTYDSGTGLSSFVDLETIKAGGERVQDNRADDLTVTLPVFSRPALSDPADLNNRRTQDWKFPSVEPPSSADPELSRFPTSYEAGYSNRPTLVHHSTEPIDTGFRDNLSLFASVKDRESLIDLDLSIPDPLNEFPRPSTASSDIGSGKSERMTSDNPFDLENHTSTITEDATLPSHAVYGAVEVSDFSASDKEGLYNSSETGQYNGSEISDSEYLSMPPPSHQSLFCHVEQPNTTVQFPSLPPPPSVAALSGTTSHFEMNDELTRMLDGMTKQLESFREAYTQLPAVQNRGVVR